MMGILPFKSNQNHKVVPFFPSSPHSLPHCPPLPLYIATLLAWKASSTEKSKTQTPTTVQIAAPLAMFFVRNTQTEPRLAMRLPNMI